MTANFKIMVVLGWSLLAFSACATQPEPGQDFEMPAEEVMIMADSCEKWERCSQSFYSVYDSVNDCIDRSIETHKSLYEDRGAGCYALSLSYEQCTVDRYACTQYPTPIGGGPCVREFEQAYAECGP